jgi:hypothetical protein
MSFSMLKWVEVKNMECLSYCFLKVRDQDAAANFMNSRMGCVNMTRLYTLSLNKARDGKNRRSPRFIVRSALLMSHHTMKASTLENVAIHINVFGTELS